MGVRNSLAACGLAVVVALAAEAVAANAQAPHITPGGDPSVRNDTIYSLAVKPQDYPGQSYITLLEDGVVRFEEDGRSRRTYRLVAQVLTPQAAEQLGTLSIPYTSGRERLTVNWVRVLHTNGSVISDKPAHTVESIPPIAQDAPVYSDTRVRQFTLSGVGANTIVDYSYTLETTKPFVPGDFWTTWSMGTGHVTRRSRFILDVPASLTPRIQERNVHFARLVNQSHGRRVYVWAATDVPPVTTEPFAPDTSTLYPEIAVAAPITWQGIASWYAGLTRRRYRLTPALIQQLSTVVSGATTLNDSLRAVYRWVAQDFRYVSISLGQLGGYLPRMPMSVWETRYGDCKDKATLFIALVRHMGVAAYPVLLSSTGDVNRSMPSAYQLDHMIAAIVRRDAGDPSSRFLFVDLTSDLTPYGSLPPPEQGEFALVVYPDGSGEEVTLPSDPVTVNRATIQITGALTPDMTFSGRYQEVASGNREYTLRSAFATSYDAADRERMARSLANTLFEGASGDSLVLFNGRDLGAKPMVELAIKDARPVSSAGSTKILTLPVRDYARPDLVAELEARDYRRSPIDAESVVGPSEETSEFRLQLPAGWQARLPPDVDATSVFGRYQAHYTQVGRELTVERSLVGATGVQPRERIDELITWLKAIDRDDVRIILLDDTAAGG